MTPGAPRLPDRLPRAFTPGEFSAALAKYGIDRSERWVRRQCAKRRIHCLPAFLRYFIPESELSRVLDETGRHSAA